MGSTPRERLTQLPLPTRSSEASTECFGRVVLSYLYEPEQADASFFILGDILHQAIQVSIENDYLLGQALEMIDQSIEQAHDDVGAGQRVKIESEARGFDTMYDDAERMLTNWYEFVHPDSDKRHPVYDDYQWPPKTELEFHRTARSAGTKYPVWGSIDALFEAKKGGYFRITDWKSGVKKPDSDFQLNFYRFGMGLPQAEANYHMLDRVRKSSIVVEADKYPGDLEIKEAISLTERRKDAIVNGRMPRFVPDWYCRYCPVQHLCPADGDPRERNHNRKQLKKLLREVEAMPVIPSNKGVDIGIY